MSTVQHRLFLGPCNLVEQVDTEVKQIITECECTAAVRRGWKVWPGTVAARASVCPWVTERSAKCLEAVTALGSHSHPPKAGGGLGLSR